MDIAQWDRAVRLQKQLIVEGQPIRSQDELVDFYTMQLSMYGLTGRALTYPREEWYRAKLQQYQAILQQLVQSTDTVLDIGCGFGALLDVIGACHYTGLDLVPSLEP